MLSSKDAISAETYNRYIQRVNNYGLMESLFKTEEEMNALLKSIPEEKADYAYAEGKWTLRELLQHVIDAERVFVHRAIWFGRKDPNPLPGFDENTWAFHSKANNRKWNDLVTEFMYLRKSTLLLFSAFDEEQLLYRGVANNTEVNVLALGYLCAGHLSHHISVIKERYLDGL